MHSNQGDNLVSGYGRPESKHILEGSDFSITTRKAKELTEMTLGFVADSHCIHRHIFCWARGSVFGCVPPSGTPWVIKTGTVCINEDAHSNKDRSSRR